MGLNETNSSRISNRSQIIQEMAHRNLQGNAERAQNLTVSFGFLNLNPKGITYWQVKQTRFRIPPTHTPERHHKEKLRMPGSFVARYSVKNRVKFSVSRTIRNHSKMYYKITSVKRSNYSI